MISIQIVLQWWRSAHTWCCSPPIQPLLSWFFLYFHHNHLTSWSVYNIWWQFVLSSPWYQLWWERPLQQHNCFPFFCPLDWSETKNCHENRHYLKPKKETRKKILSAMTGLFPFQNQFCWYSCITRCNHLLASKHSLLLVGNTNNTNQNIFLVLLRPTIRREQTGASRYHCLFNWSYYLCLLAPCLFPLCCKKILVLLRKKLVVSVSQINCINDMKRAD